MSNGKASKAKVSGTKTPAKKSSAAGGTDPPAGGKASDTQSWPHLKYDFLQPDKIRDINKNRPDHPNYDPKTVHVPLDFLDKLTPVNNKTFPDLY